MSFKRKVDQLVAHLKATNAKSLIKQKSSRVYFANSTQLNYNVDFRFIRNRLAVFTNINIKDMYWENQPELPSDMGSNNSRGATLISKGAHYFPILISLFIKI